MRCHRIWCPACKPLSVRQWWRTNTQKRRTDQMRDDDYIRWAKNLLEVYG